MTRSNSHVCVYCGAQTGVRATHRKAAESLGTKLAQHNAALVYGGGAIGLMGVLADAVLDGGGEVIGVIPEFLATKELKHPGVTRMEVVGSMHDRKARMAELADCFVALPGGYGTLEELMETITWAQLGLHRKPIGLLNSDGFFDPLVAMIDRAIEEGFIEQSLRGLFVVSSSPLELLDQLEDHQMPKVKRWLEEEEV